MRWQWQVKFQSFQQPFETSVKSQVIFNDPICLVSTQQYILGDNDLLLIKCLQENIENVKLKFADNQDIWMAKYEMEYDCMTSLYAWA